MTQNGHQQPLSKLCPKATPSPYQALSFAATMPRPAAIVVCATLILPARQKTHQPSLIERVTLGMPRRYSSLMAANHHAHLPHVGHRSAVNS